MLPLDQALNDVAPFLGLGLLLVVGLAIATGTVDLTFAEDEPPPANPPTPARDPRRLEGDPARVAELYGVIGSEYVVSRMRPCDAHWYTGRDFGDER